MTIPIIYDTMFATAQVPFNNHIIQGIIGDEDITHEQKKNDIQEYVLKYFLPCQHPVCVLHWNPLNKSIVMYAHNELPHILKSQKLIKPELDEYGNPVKKKGKIVIDEIWDPLSWFEKEVLDLAALTMDLKKPVHYRENGQTYVNLFAGFLHDGIEPSSVITPELKVVLDHIKIVWCSGNEQVYNYVIKWFARVAQREKNRTLLYLKSGQGSGKSCITEFMREHVFGHNATKLLDNPNEALSDFNGLLEGCTLVGLEEPQQASTGEWHKLSNQLKSLCTGLTLSIHKKYKDRYQIANTVSFVVMTNHNALFVEQDDRRIVALDVSKEKVGDRTYFDRLHECLVNDVGKQMFAYLLSVDLKDFDELKNFPNTATKKQIKTENIPILFDFIKQEYLAKSAGICCKFAEFYDNFGLFAAEHKYKGKLTKISVSQQLSDMEIKVKQVKRKQYGPSPVSFLEVPFDSLRHKLDQKGWISEIDDIPEEEFVAPTPSAAVPRTNREDNIAVNTTDIVITE